MDEKYFVRFQTGFVRINKFCYKIESLTPHGVLYCHILDAQGYPKYNKPATKFELDKIELHEIVEIGPQPGWDLQY